MKRWTKKELERKLKINNDTLSTFLIAITSMDVGATSTIGYGQITKVSEDTFKVEVTDESIEQAAHDLTEETNRIREEESLRSEGVIS